MSVINSFLAKMASFGYPPIKTEVAIDDKPHRFGDNNKCWYVLHENAGVISGAFGDWSNGEIIKWRSDTSSLAKEELVRVSAEIAAQRVVAEQEKQKLQAKAASTAQKVWYRSDIATKHPYLEAKGVHPYKVRIHPDTGALVIPLRDGSGKITTLQYIDNDGNKKYLPDGKKEGSYMRVGTEASADMVLVCEGYATGLSLYECLNCRIAVAMDAGNLLPVGKSLRGRFPDLVIVYCVDSDASGTGLKKSTQAAMETNGLVVIPEFMTGYGDFNDLHQIYGKDEVADQITQQLWHQ